MNMRSLAACLGLAGLITVGGVAVGSGSTSAASSGVTDPMKVDQALIEAWNAQRFDDLRSLLTDDVVVAAPNHEPTRDADEAIRLFKQLRPLTGKFRPGAEVHKAVGSGDLHTVSASYVFESGVRITDTSVFARQPDGTWKYAMVQTGMRDPLR